MSDEMRIPINQQTYQICKLCWSRLISVPHNLRPAISSTSVFSNYIRTAAMSSIGAVPQVKETQDEQREKHFDINENPYYAKYKEKLQKMAQANPQDFQEKLTELDTKLQEEMVKNKEVLEKERNRKTEELSSSDEETTHIKSLNEIMKLGLITDKPQEEIEKIWKDYHSAKDCVYGVVKKDDFDILKGKSRKHKSFLYPLPRENGYEFILSQIKGNEVHFTPLIMYQRMQDSSEPCLSITHYTDLKESKGIVLFNGTYDAKLLSKIEALNLIKQMLMYFGQFAMERFELVKKFNKNPENFDYKELIENYQNMKSFVET